MARWAPQGQGVRYGSRNQGDEGIEDETAWMRLGDRRCHAGETGNAARQKEEQEISRKQGRPLAFVVARRSRKKEEEEEEAEGARAGQPRQGGGGGRRPGA